MSYVNNQEADNNTKTKISNVYNLINESKIKIERLIACKYTRETDFSKMINDPEYDDYLFIFNDNYTEHRTTKRGAGNACIRPYNNYSRLERPRSFGIPTGNYRSGYSSLDLCINDLSECLIELIELIKIHNYKGIIYSVNNSGDYLIGNGIFEISTGVLIFITQVLFAICQDSEKIRLP